jgi:hypothetical protein
MTLYDDSLLGKWWAKWQSINYDYPKSFQWFSWKEKQENLEKERIKTQRSIDDGKNEQIIYMAS